MQAKDHDHADDHHHDAPAFLPEWLRHRWEIALVTVTGLALALGFFGERFFGLPANLALACYIVAYLTGGWEVARDAFPAMLRGKFDTDILMLAAAAGAAVINHWPEGAFLLFLFSLGHAGEHYALDRARNAVKELGALMPRTAHVQRGGRVVEVAVEALAVGEVVVVRPGDRVPVDGTIVAGESTLDQSAITGESAPVERRVGDEVFAGTINRENALDVRVARLAADNTLARVMRLVAEAQEQQSPTQQFAEKFTRIFVPAVLVGTALVIVLPPLLMHWAWTDSFYRGMLLLVAASPCALAIGTPAAVLAGIAQAARRGILIKGGVHLANLGSLRVIALDKTGTLTTGRFRVTGVTALGGVSEEDVLRAAAAVEEQSSHPLAAAIVKAAHERHVTYPAATALENFAGRGLRAQVDGTEVLLGALRAFPDDPRAAAGSELVRVVSGLEAAGNSTVIVRRANEFIGVIALADEARRSAQPALAHLKTLGIEHLVMLTGDNRAVAARIAQEVGVTDFKAGLLPEDKLTAIRELRLAHGPIGMVGDGVNDAPALASATVGIAMGGAGTAVALETADVALMGDDLEKLAYSVALSRASQRIIKQNLFIALGVIGLLVIASLSGAIVLSVAVVFHEGSTVVVVLNSLRLLGWKPRA
jgi:Cd2+/Zn2+-exporting ATPase